MDQSTINLILRQVEIKTTTIKIVSLDKSNRPNIGAILQLQLCYTVLGLFSCTM